MNNLDAVVYNAAELVLGAAGRKDINGESQNGDNKQSLERYETAGIAIVDGRVAAVGPSDTVIREYPPKNAKTAVDAEGKAVVPGFVDPHTHALFAGDRSDEFAARLRGRDYQEILDEGGGILRTVRAVNEADEDELLDRLLGYLDTALAYGATTIEVKSGYGLNREAELRMLDVIDRADDRHPVDVVPTFMGAHAIPKDVDKDEYVDRIIDEQLPAVEKQGIAEFCDVFCEEGVFDVDQSRRVLEAGTERGLKPKIHAEEFTRLGGAELAADLGAVSADHLLHATKADAEMIVEAGVTPVFLPAAAFSLQEAYADPAPFREAGAPVALGTDFNPNCHSMSVPMTITLGCLGMGLTPEEALLGVTQNAALALNREDGTGTLREGAPGDLNVLDETSHTHIPYSFGENPIRTVLKDGEVVEPGDRING